MKTSLLTFFMILWGFLAFADFPSDSIYQLNSKVISSEGKETNLSELAGKPVVISMAYTSCMHTCPLTVAQMQQLENDLQAKGKTDITFVLVSFDPTNDTPAVLKKYMEKKKLSSHWRFYTANSDKTLREIANVLGIKYKKTEDGGFDHSFIISVLDKDGVVKGQQIGADKNPKDLAKFIK